MAKEKRRNEGNEDSIERAGTKEGAGTGLGRRRLGREREAVERQVAAGRDADGVALDAGSPDRVLARNSKRWSSLAFATRRRRFGKR